MVLVAISLAVGGCGGSGTTPRTVAGVREDYRTFLGLLATSESRRACADYVAVAYKAWLEADKRGSCSSFFQSAWTKDHDTVSAAMAALKTIRVHGEEATIKTTKGTRVMVYAGGHWEESLGYMITVTDPGGGTFSITRHANGSITRSCPARAPGCSPSGTW